MSGEKLTLAIETAVCGGSLSLWRGAAELDGWVGTSEISKAQDILDEIAKIFERSAVPKKSIARIVVSRGPGSYTGIRLGMAIGLGLKKSLDCALDAAALLPAMISAPLKKEGADGEKIITAVPFGRNQICWQEFEVDGQGTVTSLNPPRISDAEGFYGFFNSVRARRIQIILHHKLYREFRENYENHLTKDIALTNAGENIAQYLVHAPRERRAGQVFRPIYINDV